MRNLNQKGFTLVELAIVLVIIGIMLGAVLKGQQLIENAKTKRIQSQMKEVAAAFYAYYDKYGYYPGDDPSATTRWSAATNGNGNGQVEGGYCSNGWPRESCSIWQHLRYAGIISGSATDTTPATLVPKHAYGGNMDMFTGTYSLGGTNYTGLWITLTNVPGDIAQTLDTMLDDGTGNGGTAGCYNGCTGGAYPTSGYVQIWFKY